MPEVNQLFFNHREVLELLIKKAGIHEGRWMFSANFGFTAGNFGPAPDQLSPGAVVTVLSVGLQRAAVDTPAAVTLDAAVINPQPIKPIKRRKVT
jgi:hypothetical protein